MEKFLFPISSKVGAKPKLKKHFPADKFLQILSTVQELALGALSLSLFLPLSLSLPPSPSLLMELLDQEKTIEILRMKVTFMLIKELLINPSQSHLGLKVFLLFQNVFALG